MRRRRRRKKLNNKHIRRDFHPCTYLMLSIALIPYSRFLLVSIVSAELPSLSIDRQTNSSAELQNLYSGDVGRLDVVYLWR